MMENNSEMVLDNNKPEEENSTDDTQDEIMHQEEELQGSNSTAAAEDLQVTVTSEATELSHMPIEILEKILLLLDGCSFARAEQVCTTWKETIGILSQKSTAWWDKCVNEIPNDILLEIMSKLYPSWREKSNYVKDIDWRTVYRSYKQWRSIGKWPYQTRRLYQAANSVEHVSCVCLSGSCIISGHLYGGIHVWNTHNKLLAVVAAHQREVSDMALMSFLGPEGHPKWHMKHDYVISTSYDHSIQINPLVPQSMARKDQTVHLQHMARVKMVRAFENYFAAISDDERISVWHVAPPENPFARCSVSKLVCTRQYPDIFIAVGLFKTEILGLTKQGNLLRCSRTKEFEIIEEKPLISYLNHPLSSDNDSLNGYTGKCCKISVLYDRIIIRNAYIWRENICVWLCDKYMMYVSVGGKNYVEYNTMPALKSHPTVVVLYANLLILGTDTGAIYIYYIETAKDLLKLDFNNFLWSHNVASTTIIDLDVSETEDGPCLAVATCSSIYYVAILQPVTQLVGAKEAL